MPRLKKKASKKAKKKRMQEEMHKFKHGQLRSSSGDKVTDRKQANAIGLSESGQSRKSVKGRKHHGKRRKGKSKSRKSKVIKR